MIKIQYNLVMQTVNFCMRKSESFTIKSSLH